MPVDDGNIGCDLRFRGGCGKGIRRAKASLLIQARGSKSEPLLLFTSVSMDEGIFDVFMCASRW